MLTCLGYAIKFDALLIYNVWVYGRKSFYLQKRNFALGCQYCFMQVVRNKYLDNV